MKFVQSIILLFFSLMSISAVANVNCSKKIILNNYKISLENINYEIENLNKILDGQSVENFTGQSLFGVDFDVKNTELFIKNLELLIQEKNGVTAENLSLSSCLNELKLKAQEELFITRSKELAMVKINFLKKNKLLGDTVRVGSLTDNNLPEMKEEIGKDSSETLVVKTELENSLIKKQTQVNEEKSAKKRELLAYENELTKVKIELLNLKIETNKNLETKINQFEQSSLELKSLFAKLDEKELIKNIEDFKKVEKIWLSLSSEKYFDLFNGHGNLELPSIPKLIDVALYEDDTSKVVELHEKIIQLRKEILKNYTDKKNQELKLLNQLVSNSSLIRENYFKKLGSEYFLKLLLDFDTYKLFKNEFVSAPYRIISFFYSKYLFVREQASLGKEGYISLLGKAFYIIFFICLFYGLRFFFQKIHDGVDRAFQYIFRGKSRSYILRKIFLLWSKVKDNSISLLWILALFLCQYIPFFYDLNLVIKVAEVYLGAKILKSIVTIFLGSVSYLDSSNFKSFKVKAEETSNKFKNIFQFYFFTMIFVEATVGRVYFYNFINYFILFYSLYHFIVESSRWDAEFRLYSEKKVSGVIVEHYFRFLNYLPKRIHSLFIFIFILIFKVFDVFISLTENFEISKKISANFFKKQIEKIEAEDGADDNIPLSYKEHFSLKSIDSTQEYVQNAQGIEGKIKSEIEEWVDGKSNEHSLVVYGDKGIGKTTLLKSIGANYQDSKDVQVRYLKVPAKTITKSKMDKFVFDIFNVTPLESEEIELDFYKIDENIDGKVIIILDEVQNVFLSQTGGFEAYYELINLINLNTENIFWIMSFNKYSWLYLDRAFGRTQFFRNVFELTGWSDLKIKELIMKRHRITPFRLSYDLLISATRSQDEIDKYASIESKFFKLLWELSRGNPRSALSLWVSALSRQSRNSFNVNIPKEIELYGIEKMPDELFFVLAQILKHENLLSSEIESTTSLQKGIVRNAIKLGLERKFLYKDERRRYMVDVSTQYGLIRLLRIKNFIYGN